MRAPTQRRLLLLAACACLMAVVCASPAGADGLTPAEQALLRDAKALQRTGGAHLAQGRTGEAIEALTDAWKLLDGQPAAPLQVRRAKIACKLGAAWLTAAEPEQAERWYGSCEQDSLATDRGDVLNRALVGQAVLLRTLGRSEEALGVLDRAWQIPDSEFRGEPERRGMLLFQRGRTLDQLGRLDEALEAYFAASRELEWAIDAGDAVPREEAGDAAEAMVARAPEGRRFYAASRVGVASLTGRLGHPAAAASDLVSILQHPDSMLVTDYTSYAALASSFALSAGDVAQASRLYEEARSSLELVGPERDRPRIERLAARLELAGGHLDEGCDGLEESWQLQQGADQLQGGAGLLVAISRCRLEQDRAAEAEAAASQAIALAVQEGDAEGWEARWQRGRVRAAAGRLGPALEDYRAALDGLDAQIESLRLDELQLGLGADASDLYDDAAAAVLAVGGPEAAEEALGIMERARARLLLASVLGIDVDPEAVGAPIAPVDDWPLPAPGAGVDRTLRGGELLRGLRGEGWDAEASARRAGLRSTGDRLERVLRRELTPEHARIVGASGTVAPEVIRDRLPAGLVVVSYRVGEASTDVFVTRRSGTDHRRLDVGRAALDEAIRGLLRTISPTGRGPGPSSEARLAGDRVGRLLLSPVAPLLEGAEAVVFVPDGNLYRLPFAALRLDERWLAERLAVGVAPSLNVLDALLQRPAGRRDSFVGVADPLGNLPAARAEVRDAAGRFEESLVLQGADADPEAVADALSRGDVVHIAAHGHLLSRQTPAFLELAGDSGSRPLSADAVLQLDVRASLVVLSACKSAVGGHRGGEALVNSLARSFLAAGASTVVGSLWDVDDVGTAELMRRFYDGLRAGQGPAAALAAAQVGMATSTEPGDDVTHPWFWAGFVAIGDPR